MIPILFTSVARRFATSYNTFPKEYDSKENIPQDVQPRTFDEILFHTGPPKGWKHAGRSWAAAELRLKSFEDLHRLWWILHHEHLCLNSEKASAIKRGSKMYNPSRAHKVRKSMSRIKKVLYERNVIYNANLKRERVRIRNLYKILKDANMGINDFDQVDQFTADPESEEWSGHRYGVDRGPGKSEKDPWGRTWPVNRPDYFPWDRENKSTPSESE